MTYGDGHDHRGEYADTRHDHDGDYAEKYHHHRDYASYGHDHDTSHGHRGEYAEADHAHPDLTSREAVGAMLEAFRVDMREHCGHQAAIPRELLAQIVAEVIKTGLVTRFEALRDRLEESLGQLEAAQARTARRLDRLEAVLDALEADDDQADDDDQHLTAAELEREAALGPGDDDDEYRDADGRPARGTVEIAGHTFTLAEAGELEDQAEQRAWERGEHLAAEEGQADG